MKTSTPGPEADASARPPRAAALPGVAMLAVLAVGLAATPMAFRDAAREAGSIGGVWPLVEGVYTERFEDDYAAALIGRDAAVDLWGAVDYALFRTGAVRVVAGRDGWLFTAEEYETPERSAANLEANLASAANAKARLDAAGIALLIAVVPPKTRIYPEHAEAAPPPARAAAAARFLDGLAAADIAHVDLAPALEAAKGEAQVFMARDTHWSPAGARAAAERIADAARDVFPGMELPSAAYRLAETPSAAHVGDLVKFTPVGPFAAALGLGPEPVRSFVAEAEAGGADAAALFGAQEIPIALVGTSYSAQDAWSFPDALRLAFQADVLDLAEEGGGPIAPMAALLDKLGTLEPQPRLVVWEWPARFVDADYAAHAIPAR